MNENKKKKLRKQHIHFSWSGVHVNLWGHGKLAWGENDEKLI